MTTQKTKPTLRCEHCGAKMVEYKHSLNAGLVIALKKLIVFGEPAALKELNLTINQFNNFQKLQYWGLVTKDKENLWEPTTTALNFFKGIPIPKSVWTYRGEFVRFGDDKTDIHTLRFEYRKKQDYISDQRPPQ